MVREHCYISQDYDDELQHYLDWTGLEDRDHVVQYPFTEQAAAPEKTEEELARIAERKKESGRRLQEQAAKQRLEKLMRKEQDLEYYRDLQEKGQIVTKKEFRRLLESNELRDENHLDRTVKDLDQKIRKARMKDLGGSAEPNPEDQEVVPTYPLLDIPDAELDEAALRQKRHQRLLKSGYESRQRAKAEKASALALKEEEVRLDELHRANDLESWLQTRRTAYTNIRQRLKDRERLKQDLGNRKSLASQIRMKSIANLASDNNAGKKRRRGGNNPSGNPDRDDNDTFGANDDDWGVYRTIATDAAGSDDEDEDADVDAHLLNLEAELLEHDPSFSEHDTLAAASDWTKSMLHTFLRGPRSFDPESAAQAHQLHLNVERIRVPEPLFQPSIAGVDQAGLVEIAADILGQRLSEDVRGAVAKDIFCTGGYTLFEGFEGRLRRELRAVLPVEREVFLRRAGDPIEDPWRGAASWAGGEHWRKARVTREEYAEKGVEYMKVPFFSFFCFFLSLSPLLSQCLQFSITTTLRIN
jgi:actin-related protein 5